MADPALYGHPGVAAAYGYAPSPYGYAVAAYGAAPPVAYGAPPPGYAVAPPPDYAPHPGYAPPPGYEAAPTPSYGSHSPAPGYAGYAPGAVPGYPGVVPGYPGAVPGYPGAMPGYPGYGAPPLVASIGYAPLPATEHDRRASLRPRKDREQGTVDLTRGGSKRSRPEQGKDDSKRPRRDKAKGDSKGDSKGARRDQDKGESKGSRKGDKGSSKGSQQKKNPGDKKQSGRGAVGSSAAATGGAKGVPADANVYVHGIPVAWGDEQLREHFAKFGKIISVKIARGTDGASKGYGFVGFEKEKNAREAIARTDGTKVGEQKLIVKMKQNDNKPEADGKGHAKTPPPAPPTKCPPGSTTYVYDVPHDWQESDLEMCFSHCGQIAKVKIGKGPDGKPKGYGFIDFETGPLSVMKAVISMDNYNASPRNRLQVNPKQGEEELIPPIPKLEFPPPGNPFNGPAHWLKPEPGSTVFCFYVPKDWTDIELFLTFVHLGDITAVKVQTRDGDAGEQESRGFGFVTFASKLSAVRAVKAMNGLNTGGKMRLQVSIRKGDEEHVESVFKEMASIPDFIPDAHCARIAVSQAAMGDIRKVPAEANIFVHHMPATWTEIEMKRQFKQYGKILSLKVALTEEGTSRCFGFVGFEAAESAQSAIKGHNGTTHAGSNKPMIVKIKDDLRAKKAEEKELADQMAARKQRFEIGGEKPADSADKLSLRKQRFAIEGEKPAPAKLPEQF